MANRLILAALFALLLLSFGCIGSGSPYILKWGWQGLAGVALMAVLLLLSLGYMASVVLNDEKMRAWVKKEAGQAAFSIIIFAVVLLVAGSLDPMLKSASTLMASSAWSDYVNHAVCCTPGTQGCIAGHRACHMEIASDYLQVMYETLRQNAVAYLSDYWWYGFLSNLSINTSFLLDEKTGGLDFSLLAGLSMPADYFSMLFELCFKMMMLVRAQQIFLDYTWYFIFPVLLSMGLMLRMLYFTRKLGGLLIAIALCAYVVFPMFYVVSSAILFNFLGGTAANWHAFGSNYNDNPATGGTTLPYTPGSVDMGANSGDSRTVFGQPAINFDLCSEDSQNKDASVSLQNAFSTGWKSYEHTGWFSQFFDFISLGSPSNGFGPKGPIATLAMIMVFTLILPFLALMTTLASVKVLSPLLGGDVEIAVLSRLI